MTMYKLYIPFGKTEPNSVVYYASLTTTCIPFDPANTDYQAFKTYLAKSGAELQDATGTAMTSEQIATFLTTLP